MPNNVFKKIALYLLGSFILIAGAALVLFWREDVVTLFRGGIGMALALAGLLVLYSLKK